MKKVLLLVLFSFCFAGYGGGRSFSSGSFRSSSYSASRVSYSAPKVSTVRVSSPKVSYSSNVGKVNYVAMGGKVIKPAPAKNGIVVAPVVVHRTVVNRNMYHPYQPTYVQHNQGFDWGSFFMWSWILNHNSNQRVVERVVTVEAKEKW